MNVLLTYQHGMEVSCDRADAVGLCLCSWLTWWVEQQISRLSMMVETICLLALCKRTPLCLSTSDLIMRVHTTQSQSSGISMSV